MKYGFGELDMHVGDIWELATQAIVSPITTNLTPRAGIGTEVAKRAGPVVAKRLGDIQSIGLGMAIRTEAGSLLCEHLIHAAICTLSKNPTVYDLEEAVNAALDICQHSAMRSVGVPAMGIDPGEIPVKAAARVIVAASLRSLKVSSHPQRIVLVVPSNYVDKIFRATIDEQAPAVD